jgi:hypothetical protein
MQLSLSYILKQAISFIQRYRWNNMKKKISVCRFQYLQIEICRPRWLIFTFPGKWKVFIADLSAETGRLLLAISVKKSTSQFLLYTLAFTLHVNCIVRKKKSRAINFEKRFYCPLCHTKLNIYRLHYTIPINDINAWKCCYQLNNHI